MNMSNSFQMTSGAHRMQAGNSAISDTMITPEKMLPNNRSASVSGRAISSMRLIGNMNQSGWNRWW